MSIRILASASDDLNRGRIFYSRQGEGVGEYFLDSLASDIDSLALYAGIHSKVYGYYRLLAKRFPYAVYYQINRSQDVVVWRVLDLRQDPSRIERALK
jgi:plasmid stabilization system protein ParE